MFLPTALASWQCVGSRQDARASFFWQAPCTSASAVHIRTGRRYTMSTTTWNRTGGQHRVLLVGPDSAHLEYLRRLLETKGFRIIRARAIAEACQKLVIVAPHLVLADLGEEHQAAGAALLPLVECAQNQPDPPSLVVVSERQEWDSGTESLRQAGASFLSKPVQPSQLLAALSLAFAAHDAASLE